jgi:hypothetical protein
MPNNKDKKELYKSTLASVKKEMAKPAMAESARIAQLTLDTARISAHKYHHARLP